MSNLDLDEFAALGLEKEILSSIKKIGFKTPSQIQKDAIPLILKRKDVVAEAQTGSGKTAAFAFPSLQFLFENQEETILAITPTRELALQVAEEFRRFGESKKIHPVTIFGGTSYVKQKKEIEKNPKVIVATPGRLLDLYKSGKLAKFHPTLIILDEADEMFKMGFLEDIQSIFSFLPVKKQILLFSATIPRQIENLIHQFLQKPVYVRSASKSLPHQDIDQRFYFVHEREKQEALIRLIDCHSPSKTIVFCKSKADVDHLYEEFFSLGYSVLSLHGDMEQRERMKIFQSFKESSSACLIATDLAGRGLDVSDVQHVYNYQLPFSSDGYTHRIGRTGRAGNKGTSHTLLSSSDIRLVKKILKIEPQKLKFENIPSKEEVKERHRHQFLEKIKNEKIDLDETKTLSLLQKEMDLEKICLHLLSFYGNGKKILGPDTFSSPKMKTQNFTSHKSQQGRFRKPRFFSDRKKKQSFSKN